MTVHGWGTEAVPCFNKTYMFFTNRGEDTAPAVALCNTCHIREECLEFALENCERFGVWGGMSAKQRRLEKRRRRLAKLTIDEVEADPSLLGFEDDEWDDEDFVTIAS